MKQADGGWVETWAWGGSVEVCFIARILSSREHQQCDLSETKQKITALWQPHQPAATDFGSDGSTTPTFSTILYCWQGSEDTRTLRAEIVLELNSYEMHATQWKYSSYKWRSVLSSNHCSVASQFSMVRYLQFLRE
jgi:hypothetical protein